MTEAMRFIDYFEEDLSKLVVESSSMALNLKLEQDMKERFREVNKEQSKVLAKMEKQITMFENKARMDHNAAKRQQEELELQRKELKLKEYKTRQRKKNRSCSRAKTSLGPSDLAT